MKRTWILGSLVLMLSTIALLSAAPKKSFATGDDQGIITFKTSKTVANAVDWARTHSLEPTELQTDVADPVGSEKPLTIFYHVEPGSFPISGSEIQASYRSEVGHGLQDLAENLCCDSTYDGSGQVAMVNAVRVDILTGPTAVKLMTVDGTTAALNAVKANSDVETVAVQSEVSAEVSAMNPPAEDPPDITLSSVPSNPIPFGEGVLLTWDNPNHVEAECEDNLSNRGGAQDIWVLREHVTQGFTWQVHCINRWGQDTKTLSVQVQPAPPPPPGPPPPPPPPAPPEWEQLEVPIDCTLPWHPRMGHVYTHQAGINRRRIFQAFIWTSGRVRRLLNCFNNYNAGRVVAYEADAQFLEPHLWLGVTRRDASFSNLPQPYLDTNIGNGDHQDWTFGSSDARVVAPLYRYYTQIDTANGPYNDYFNGQIGLDRRTRYFITNPACNRNPLCVAHPGQTIYPPEPLRYYHWHQPETMEWWIR